MANPNGGWKPKCPDRSPSPSAYSLLSPAGNGSRSGRKTLTDEERVRYPGSDTRWPLPSDVVDKPYHFLYTEKGVTKAIYYHLVYQSTSPKAQEWLNVILDKAFEEADNIPQGEDPQITIMNVLKSRKLKVLSDGVRGKVWLLDQGSAGVWTCIDDIQAEKGTVRLPSGYETFEEFGWGLKGNHEDILLISRPGEPNTK
ncbi:hypothetical protein CC86DRAFT_297577 [Ophiobolus disseminans]|uniref:Uncharacterized protein n=1 Tax=Ophiobolus disseminans TaxID=1469910 RepID=A0A6A6ZU38_9PLEO|nr:hypothetical protein CC86DRAFT_297577 [Ophiobolus disseminans]